MIKKVFFTKSSVFLWLFLCTSNAWSQYQYDDQPEQQNYSLADQTKSDLMVIMTAGIGGAVLGLSTLSFVDEPGDHFDNVLTGAAVGLILGVVYVAYRQAYGPAGVFSLKQDQIPSPDKMSTKDFYIAKNVSTASLKNPSFFQWTWQF